MIANAGELEQKYRYSAAAYWYVERHCHDDIQPETVIQRDITRWSFEVIRGVRSDVQPFTNMLIQFPQAHAGEPGQVAPDNAVIVHSLHVRIGVSFDTPFQPVRPLIVMGYSPEGIGNKEGANRAKYEQELKVPYYLLFYPDADEFTLFKLGETGYSAVHPNANGRCPIPELELEVGLHGKWMRYWFRGELLPLPGELLQERDAERAARIAAEAEVATLREELAKAKGQQG
jgi:hypothetical protein